MEQRRAVTGKQAAKYRGCKSRKERRRILDEIVELTDYHRKYAAWLLRNYGKKRVVSISPKESVILVVGKKNKRRAPVRPRKYDEAVREQIEFIWDTLGLCSKRMKAAMVDLIPALIKRGHFSKGSDLHLKLLQISPATIDRLLKPERAKYKPHGSTLTKPGSILRSYIPIVTSSELNTKNPGHYQIDLVGHAGGNPNGHFCYTLNAVELSSGWIAPRIVLNKAQKWTQEALADRRDVADGDHPVAVAIRQPSLVPLRICVADLEVQSGIFAEEDAEETQDAFFAD